MIIHGAEIGYVKTTFYICPSVLPLVIIIVYENYHCLRSSTWDDGELQDDWSDLVEDIADQDLSGKKVALFGCGDSEGYGDTFCDAVGILKEELSNSGCTFVGAISKDGYEYEASRAEEGGKLVGCCLDEDNQDDLTDERIDRWVEAVKSAL